MIKSLQTIQIPSMIIHFFRALDGKPQSQKVA
jgi:hypothetical protein